ncbi:hypothetical protein D9M69_415490 [compost metagenome]
MPSAGAVKENEGVTVAGGVDDSLRSFDKELVSLETGMVHTGVTQLRRVHRSTPALLLLAVTR